MLMLIRSLFFPSHKTAIILTITFVVIICFGTLTPLHQKIDVPGTDKWHHFVAFAALVYPLASASKRYWLKIIIFSLLLGASIEIIQPYLNRFGEIKDFIADAIGVSVGILLAAITHKFRL
ncbi:MAG: VanZ family protein [Amylibacter sp.]|jgi:VanZ family protein|tara:strand:+ start:4182 stop:4544 length:363 start_codon:yes stop_codon:yes gene_type:complete